MMKARTWERNYVWIGLLMGAIPLLGWGNAPLPSDSITIVAFLFTSLITIFLILPTISNFKQFEFIQKSGHIDDLMLYLKTPLLVSFLVFLVSFAQLTSSFALDSTGVDSAVFALWGVLFLSLFRVIAILPKILLDKRRKR